MAEEVNVAPEGASEQPSIEQIEAELGSFDFDSKEPAGAKEKASEPGDAEASAAPAGTDGAEEPAAEDDDPEINLRDNQRVKLSELKRGYRPDWEKQAQQFAQRAQEFERTTAGFNQAQQQTAILLQQAVDFVQARMPTAPDVSLIDTDPFEYQKQKAVYDIEAGKLQQLQATRAAFIQQSAVQQRQEMTKRLYEEREAAIRALPDLKDPVKAAKFSENVRNLGSKLGFSPAEMNQIRDHRLLKLVNLALQGEQAQAALEKAKAKLKATEKPPVEVQAPQRRRTPAQADAERMRTAMARLSKNPSSAKAAEDVLSQFD